MILLKFRFASGRLSFVPLKRTFYRHKGRALYQSATLLSMATAVSSQSRHTVKLKKRIIIACDGTWLDSDSNGARDEPHNPFNRSEHLIAPSNVTRLCRAIKREATVGSQTVPQIVYYQSGVGSQSFFSAKLLGGATGSGISSNIRE